MTVNCRWVAENDAHSQYLRRKLTPLQEKQYLAHIKICGACARTLVRTEIRTSKRES